MLGGIGQPLSLLLKLNKKISELALYDIRGTPGVAADISHVDTHSKVPSRLCSEEFSHSVIAVTNFVRSPDTLPKPREMA